MDFFKDFAAAGRRNATARVTITPLYAGHMRAVWAVGRNAQVAGQPALSSLFLLMSWLPHSAWFCRPASAWLCVTNDDRKPLFGAFTQTTTIARRSALAMTR